ncbi:MAG: glycine cleavage system aminomethyltransferase GcvT [Fimbriiglobus sp.]
MANLRTPLYDLHLARKARVVPFAGWDMPVQYSSVLAEHEAVRTAAGLFDISHMARLSVGGPDSLKFVENVFTNAVAPMAMDQVRYGLVCDDAGGILDDVLVYRWPYGLSIVVNASNRTKILAWFETHRAGLDVRISDETERTAMIAVQGPKSVEMCQGLFDFDPGTLKYYYARPTLYCCQPCVVSRTGYTGEDGLEVIVPNELAVTLWDELEKRGAKPCGLGARDTLRLEAAMPLYGHEMDETVDPFTAGLSWAVKLKKGEFLGQSALAAIQAAGPAKVRVGLRLGGNRAARQGSRVLAADGTPVGVVTSGSFSPTLKQSIAMATVGREFAAIDTPLGVEVPGSTLPAAVVKLPFYSRNRE